MSFEQKVKKNAEKLLKKSDKIALALSGGKDSMTTLYLLNKWGYNVEAFMIHPGFKHFSKHVKNASELCNKLGVKLNILNVEEEIGETMRSLQLRTPISNCHACGVVKKWLLNKHTKGFDKLVTGHNADDYVEAILMNLVMNNQGQCNNLGAKSEQVSGFTPRFKPLNDVRESDIKAYSEKIGLKIDYSICPYSSEAFRRDVKNLIEEYELSHANFIKYFEKIKKKIKVEKNPLKSCSECGEPTNSEICNACQLTQKRPL